MILHTCVCSNSTEIHFFESKQKQSCCSAKQNYQDTSHQQINKKNCCLAETISLKTEHQSEQVRLNLLPSNFFQSIILAEATVELQLTEHNNITGVTYKSDIPPKTPLIYQYSHLLL